MTSAPFGCEIHIMAVDAAKSAATVMHVPKSLKNVKAKGGQTQYKQVYVRLF